MSAPLTFQEVQRIYELVEMLTGNCQEESYRKDLILSNVVRRIQATEHETLEDYLGFAFANSEEMSHLLSAMTIHTTGWFRENEHYLKFADLLSTHFKHLHKIRLLSCGCSTGEELYSFGLVLENAKIHHPFVFDYALEGFDIDPISIEIAKKNKYDISEKQEIPFSYQRFLKIDFIENFLAVQTSIRERAKFYTDNLLQLHSLAPQFEVVVCRNVLIYFSPDHTDAILDALASRLVQNGILILGHGDNVAIKNPHLKMLVNSIYLKI